MSNFIICFFFSSLPGDNFVSVDAESLAILIEFSLITGNFNNILDSLQILMGKTLLVTVYN